MSRRPLAAWSAGALALGLIATVGLALTVASSGAVRVWSDPPAQYDVGARPATTDEISSELPDLGDLIANEPTTNTSWLSRVFAVVGLMVLLALAYVVVSTWWRVWRERDRASVATAASLTALDATVGGDVELDEVALFDALAHGEPRNAIVACWLQLEDDVAAAGWPRHVAETSAEYTARVLAAAGLDRMAATTLADLYREARFSTHPLGEADRSRAAIALQAVHRSLRQREVAR
jgi:hypothetical protein